MSANTTDGDVERANTAWSVFRCLAFMLRMLAKSDSTHKLNMWVLLVSCRRVQCRRVEVTPESLRSSGLSVELLGKRSSRVRALPPYQYALPKVSGTRRVGKAQRAHVATCHRHPWARYALPTLQTIAARREFALLPATSCFFVFLAERAELNQQLAEAKLVALSAQIEPHFLFNTLASVQYLIRHDADKAHEMTSDLIRYLRLALPKMKEVTAPLASEIELVRAYLDIMQIRMGDRLQYRIDMPSEFSRVPIPTTALIILVENAIKHGLERNPGGGRVDVLVASTTDALTVTVADTGGGFSTESSGTGIGLVNIRERLTALYGAQGQLTLAANQPSGVTATLTIPHITSSNNTETN